MNEIKSLPNSEMAEKAVLSVALQSTPQDNHIASISALNVNREHFYHPANREIFSAILERFREGKDLDLIAMIQTFTDEARIDELGGPAYISEIYTYTPTSQHLNEHCKILTEKLAQRKAILQSQSIIAKAEQGTATPEELQSAIRLAGEDLSNSFAVSDRTVEAKDACIEFQENFRHVLQTKGMVGIPTGIQEIDNLTGGMRPQDLWSIAAYPSCGKSTLMLQIAYNAAKAGKRVVVFSLEMSNSDLVAGLVSYGQNLYAGDLFNPKSLDKRTMQGIKRGLQELTELQITFCDRANLSMDTIEAECDKLNNQGGVDVIVVDYWQIIGHSKPSKIEGLEDNSHRLKQLAKATNSTVITGSQLNDDGKLKGSRKLGEDSNVTMRLPQDDESGIFVAKNRNGERNVNLPLRLNGAFRRFERAEITTQFPNAQETDTHYVR